MVTTCTEIVYIEGATTMIGRLARIEAIIEGLELMQVESIGASNLDEYEIDDGQTKIKTKYVTASSMTAAIVAYEAIANKLRNKLNGRTMALRNANGIYR